IREELELCDIPKPLEGAAITLIVAGILAMAFMGFTGVDSGLRKAMTPAAEQAQCNPADPAVMLADAMPEKQEFMKKVN
ncbi:MAG: hypothetical protein MUE70_01780, partial [Desulfobacterales bacterium]|nr:hypothetical protein [Desulfobacterales bacterium]